jgi:S-adenosylhomocysteine hydrolase
VRFNLLTSIEAFCEEKKVSELVNDLQLFFIITPQEPRIEIPIDEVNALPLTPERIRSHIKGLGMINSPATIFITSRPISPFRELFWDHDVPILSNNRTENRADANAVWLARRLLHIGMSLFAKTACLDTTCVCNNLDNFLTLCGQCEEKLRSQGYRDGIARLKDGINWLNQRYEVAKPDLIVHPLINPDTHLTLADYYARKYQGEGRRPFGGKIILMVLHFLSDLLPFVEALNKLGASFSDIYLVAKPYPYAKRDLVSHELERRGVNVYRATRSHDVSAVAEEVLRHLQQSKVLKDRKVLVIEDGGYFGPLLHEPVFNDILSKCVGIVEQTTKGIRRDRKKVGESPLVPILSVAESKFKADYESPEIGRITIQNISRFVPNVKLSGRRAVVFGFGSIGEHVAAHLNRSFNMGVSVVDIDAAKLLKALHRKDIVSEAVESFDKLILGKKAKLFVGTTGETSMNDQILTSLPNDCILVSTSSDREEIDMDWFIKTAGDQGKNIEEGKTEYHVSVNGEMRTYTVLADGYPINFYGSESLPNDTIDPIMTLLLLCGIDVCEKQLSPEIHTDYVNDDLQKKHKLVEEFLKLCMST